LEQCKGDLAHNDSQDDPKRVTKAERRAEREIELAARQQARGDRQRHTRDAHSATAVVLTHSITTIVRGRQGPVIEPRMGVRAGF